MNKGWRWWVLAIPACVVGCAYRVQLTSDPMPVEVLLPSGKSVFTPTEQVFRYVPFQKQTIVVSSPGYRTMTMDLRRREIKAARYVSDAVWHPNTFFGAPRGDVRIVMVPEHGPSGTWRPDEIAD